jgi:hypothetical protein
LPRKLSINDLSGVKLDDESRAATKGFTESHDEEFKLCASDFWYFSQFLITYDEENEIYRPFPQPVKGGDYEYLLGVHEDVQTHQKNLFLKGRRLIMSWYFMARMFWGAKFAGCGGSEVYRGGVFSVSEDEVIELLNRPESMNDKLPEWLKSRNPLVTNKQTEKEFQFGGKIHGFPAKRQGPRTWGFSEAFFDEMAFQEFARTIWKGLTPALGAKGKLNAVSTPNGKFNLFSDIWHKKGGRYQEVNRVRLDWWLHPEHDQAWRDALASSLTEAEVAQELDLSFAIPAGDAVFPETTRKVHVATEELSFQAGKPVYIGFDLGYHFPAVTIWQRNHRDQWVGLREFCMYDTDFETFCAELHDLMDALYDRKRTPELFCLPPDAKLNYRIKTKTGAQNDVMVLKEVFHLQPHQIRFCPQEVGSRDNEGPRLKLMRLALKLRKDGEPGMYWSPSMEMFTDAMLGGYCYPEVKSGSPPSEQPMKNEYSHIADSAQAVPAAYATMVDPDTMVPEKHRDPLILDRVHRTGRKPLKIRGRR